MTSVRAPFSFLRRKAIGDSFLWRFWISFAGLLLVAVAVDLAWKALR